MIEKSELMNQALLIPDAIGVYIFKAQDGEYIYIGFSRKLRSRCMAHIIGQSGQFKAAAIISLSCMVEAIETKTIEEAKSLEKQLIVKHKPRYNKAHKNIPNSEKRHHMTFDIDPEKKLEMIALAERRNITLKTWLMRAIEHAIKEERKHD